MNALFPQPSLPGAAAAAPAGANGPAAAVLPPAVLAVLAMPLVASASGQPAAVPTFDRALQQLLGAGGLPPAADPASIAPQPALADSEAEAEADAQASASALQFDPALASLVPPAAVAMAQASQAGAQAAPVRPAPLAPAGVQTVSAAGRDGAPVPSALVAASTPTAATAALAAAPADPAAALLQDRPAGASAPTATLPQAVGSSTIADVADSNGAARAGEPATPGRTPSLLQTLGDRIAVQLERGSERVVIRLDPPHRGQIEIHIRQDASGATQVQLNASHGEVVRQLHAIGDSLRQELAQRQGGDVSVQIAQQGRDPDGRQRQDREGQQQQQPGRALDEQAQAAANARFALATDSP